MTNIAQYIKSDIVILCYQKSIYNFHVCYILGQIYIHNIYQILIVKLIYVHIIIQLLWFFMYGIVCRNRITAWNIYTQICMFKYVL